ncbi:hypothetical protein HDU67_002483 [Dinochytrium kinnereticum]|nr:hypothetical protein HDU67_002483 [Dinochytrium kinnereticum]
MHSPSHVDSFSNTDADIDVLMASMVADPAGELDAQGAFDDGRMWMRDSANLNTLMMPFITGGSAANEFADVLDGMQGDDLKAVLSAGGDDLPSLLTSPGSLLGGPGAGNDVSPLTGGMRGRNGMPTMLNGSTAANGMPQDLSAVSGTTLAPISSGTGSPVANFAPSFGSARGVDAEKAMYSQRLLEVMERQMEELNSDGAALLLSSPSTLPLNPVSLYIGGVPSVMNAIPSSPRTSPLMGPPSDVPLIFHQSSPSMAFSDNPLNQTTGFILQSNPRALTVDLNLLTKPAAPDLSLNTPTGTVYSLDPAFDLITSSSTASATPATLSGSEDSNLSAGSSASRNYAAQGTPHLSHSPSLKAIEFGLDDLTLASRSPELVYAAAAAAAGMLTHFSPNMSPLLNTNLLSPHLSPYPAVMLGMDVGGEEDVGGVDPMDELLGIQTSIPGLPGASDRRGRRTSVSRSSARSLSPNVHPYAPPSPALSFASHLSASIPGHLPRPISSPSSPSLSYGDDLTRPPTAADIAAAMPTASSPHRSPVTNPVDSSASTSMPFACRHCLRGFARKHDMLRHERLHEGLRVVCESCGKTFARPDGLKRHLRTALEKGGGGGCGGEEGGGGEGDV